jgi:hemerythrin-like domain-containing protein
MTLRTQPLRDEHRELLPHVEQILEAANSVEPGAPVSEQVAAAYKFLAEHLMVHAGAEEAALYPAVARLTGAPESILTMTRDHVEIRRLTEQLSAFRREPGPLDPA